MSRKPEPRAKKQPARPHGGSSIQPLSAYGTNHLGSLWTGGIALVAGTVSVSMAQLLNTFLRDCAFEFAVH